MFYPLTFKKKKCILIFGECFPARKRAGRDMKTKRRKVMYTVIKRDGKEVNFDLSKIRNAITKALTPAK